MAATTTLGYYSTFGIAMQTVAPTGAPAGSTAPSGTADAVNSQFIRWLQGSMLRPNADFRQEWEGDNSRGQALNYKAGQWSMAKLVHYPRADDAAFVLAAFCGQGSDSCTSSSPSTGHNTHVITPVLSAASNYGVSNYYSIQNTLGYGTGATILIAQDMVCQQLQITAGVSSPLVKFESDWLGGYSTQTTGSVPTITWPTAEMPFYFFGSTWTLGTTLTGSAGNTAWEAAVRDLSLTFSSELTPGDFQAESIVPLVMQPGNLKVTGNLTLIWQDGGVQAAAYFAGTGTDTPNIVTGALTATFLCGSDSTQTFEISIPAASYNMSEIVPDLSGKPVLQTCQLTGLASVSGGTPTAPFTATIIDKNIATAFSVPLA